MSETLKGLRIWLTRPGEAGLASAQTWNALGAQVTHVPTVQIQSCDPSVEERSVLDDLPPCTILALTSPTAAANFVSSMGLAAPDGDRWRAVAVGEATAAKARSLGLEVAWVATRATGTDLAAEILELEDAEVVVVPGSDRRRPELPAALQNAGVRVAELTVHRTVATTELPAVVSGAVEADEFDILLAYSPSALSFLDSVAEPIRERILAIPTACLGPTTASFAEELGVEQRVVAADPGEASLIDAVKRWWRSRAKD